MIQIYNPENKNFEMNGDMTLTPSICEHVAELGGVWSLDLTHHIDQEGRWKYIREEAVISAPTFMSKNQLFRIKEITDKTNTEISARAYPIFLDAENDCFLMDVRPTEKNGQGALDAMTQDSIYSGESDIDTLGTAYFIRRNLINAICGEDTPTFIEVWGGEALYDNFKIILNKTAGGDYGTEIRYGKNLEAISVKIDTTDVVTRIVPVAYNGHTHTNGYVDSPLIDKYAKKYIREIKFENVKLLEDVSENEETEGIILCADQEQLDKALEKQCQAQFDTGLDLFKATIDINVAQLEDTEEYKDFKELVKIGLGDTVRCCNTLLDIDTKARAIKITWDCIRDKVSQVTLGDYRQTALDNISNAIDKIENITKPDGSVNAEKVQGILNAMYTQLRYQKDVAQKQDVRAILFEDLDPESELYGALAIGTQGLEISKKRTADGRGWDWSTAITANGVYADTILTGTLTDKTGKNYWNLDTGEMNLEKLNISIKELQDATVMINSDEPEEKSLWLDTSSSPPILKRWNGESWDIVNDNAEQITQIYKELTSVIDQASDNIMFQVGERTYSKEETDQLISDMNTSLTQTKNSFEFEFNNFQANLESLGSSTDSKFENINKYIRFIDGEIWIGIEGNPIMLRQRNDRISFLENNVEVAYISNRTLYFTHAEILKDLKIGRFGFVVMESGYTPFKLLE